MICSMKRWLLNCAVGLVLSLAPTAQAQDEEVVYDPRVENYPQERNVKVEAGSTALTWLLMIFLGVVCVSVTFKNAKRTHLD